MDLTCEERPSDSPFVEKVWYSRSEQAGDFISLAESHCEMVVTKYKGQTFITMRGPESQATRAYSPAEAEYMGIQFRAGVFFSPLPVRMIMNRHDVTLPQASSQSFWLQGSAWQFPNIENADTFVARLARAGLMGIDLAVAAALQMQPVKLSTRTLQRRFVQVTGLTRGEIHQIERARYAAGLLKQGVSILDTVSLAGYFDQPHMTRALKRLIGQTPAQIIDKNRTERLSFLYKTQSLSSGKLWLYSDKLDRLSLEDRAD